MKNRCFFQKSLFSVFGQLYMDLFVKVTNVQREIIKAKSRWFLMAEDALPLEERGV